MEEAGHLGAHTEAEDPLAPAPMVGALGAPVEEAAPMVGAPWEEAGALVGAALRVVGATLVTGDLAEEAVAPVVSEGATSPAPAALGCPSLAGEAATR